MGNLKSLFDGLAFGGAFGIYAGRAVGNWVSKKEKQDAEAQAAIVSQIRAEHKAELEALRNR